MARFELDMIQTTALSSAVCRLSPLSLALIVTALEDMTMRFNWFDAEIDTEWDQIEAAVGTAYREVLQNMLIGSVVWFAGGAPDGTLVCDGSTYGRIHFPLLYAALVGTAYVVDADNFTVPDLRDRFILGQGASSSVADTGGEAQHTLTEAEMPAHSHTYVPPTINIDVEAPGVPDPVAAGIGLPTSTGVAGSGQPHNNMPPYEVLLPCIIAR